MKALVKKYSKPGLWLEEVPVPTIGKNDVLIKVNKTALCGTDIHIYQWDDWAQKNVPVPLVTGHEFMGVITEVGENVQHFHPGMRVTGEGHLTCGQCLGCREGKRHLCSRTRGVGYHTQGSFAEYFALPAENVFVLPDSVSDEIASLFDPFGNAVHTSFTLQLPAQSILITGAGPMGLMAAAIAKHCGAKRVIVTDVNPWRLKLAKQMGATDVINVAQESLKEYLKKSGLDEGVDGGMEMSGSSSGLNDLLENCKMGAMIALLGILPPNTAIDWNLVIFKLLNIKGIWGREIFATWNSMVNLIEGGLDLNPIITHRYRFDEFEKGFEAMMSGTSGKVILDWV